MAEACFRHIQMAFGCDEDHATVVAGGTPRPQGIEELIHPRGGEGEGRDDHVEGCDLNMVSEILVPGRPVDIESEGRQHIDDSVVNRIIDTGYENLAAGWTLHNGIDFTLCPI